jgi:hypothetical protein
MEHLYQTLYQGLWLAQAAFTIWMLVDAYRRGADWFWYWIIFTGIGAWAYFFAVKLGDFHGVREWSIFQRRPAVGELRYRVQQLPTLTNRLALGRRLVELHEYEEAVPLLEAVLAQEPELVEALHALAVCRAEQGHPEQAAPLLEKLIAKHSSWSNYAAWHMLIRVQAESGDGGKALATCRQLDRVAPTLQHHCLLAERLLEEGLHEEAGKLLERSLEEHRFAPGFIRRRNWRWAGRARQLQREAAAR